MRTPEAVLTRHSSIADPRVRIFSSATSPTKAASASSTWLKMAGCAVIPSISIFIAYCTPTEAAAAATTPKARMVKPIGRTNT